MDATELGRWTRFAAKGGIGKCSAIQDCVAESPEDLMFLMEDEIVVLLQLPEIEGMYLGYCEGVVGRFHASHVRFHGKLKKPVMTKRSSMTAAKSPTPSASQSASPLPTVDSPRSPAMPGLHLSPESQLSPPPTRLSMTEEAEEPVEHAAPADPVQVTASEEVRELNVRPTVEATPPTRALSPESVSSLPFHDSPQPISAPDALTVPENTIGNRQSTMSDGEVGIGLSLLQDVEDDDDWSSTQSRYSTHSGANSPVSTEEYTVEDDQRTETTHGPPMTLPAPLRKPDPSEPVSPDVMPQSPTESLAPSSMTKRSDDWESGMSDIYDNYRYSRYSMASRNSRFSQSSPQPSMHSIPPPIPDSRIAPRSSIDSEVSIYTQNSRASMDPLANQRTVLAPPPMEIEDQTPTPLLNTRWETPLVSPAVSSFSVASGQGVANAIRQRLESERGNNDVGLSAHDMTAPGILSGVVDDDEELPSFARDSVAHEDWNSDVGSPVTSPAPNQSKALPSVDGPTAPSATATSPTSSRPVSPRSPMITITPLHTRDVAPLPPTSSDLSPPTHTLRPSLSELRGYEPGSSQGQGQRQSLFLPHPNAPKATVMSEGPMYIRNPWPVHPPSPSVAAPANAAAFAVTVLRNILQTPRPGARTPLTIYGRLEMDFSKTTGPVPVTFSGEYLAPPPPPVTPRIPSSPLARSASPVQAPPPIGTESRSGSPNPTPLPRPNFFPQASSSRPRSRSFSDFQYPVPKSPQASRDPSRSLDREEPLLANIPPAPQTVTPVPASPTLKASVSTPRLHSPSPLSITTSGTDDKPLRSPLRATTDASVPGSPIRPHQLRQVTSMSAFMKRSSSPPKPIVIPKNMSGTSGITSPTTTSPTRLRKQSVETESLRDSRASIATESDTTRSRLSTDQRESISPISSRSNVISPSPFGAARQSSMRTKLSLPNLRRHQSRAGSLVSTQEISETMQVRDMDFELVRPTIPAITQDSPRTSEDGSSITGTPQSLTDNGRAEILTPFRRAESPTLSVTSAVPSVAMPRSPTVPENFGSALSRPPLKSAESEVTMEAHRQREGKWVSLISTVPASQAKKNKRIRKLVQEGVPSSVRYQVWSHLMDSKARKVRGVYTKLGERPKVPAFSEIERDVAECFSEHPQLQSTQGPLLSLLQAYLTMVPDIKYTTGLTLIAGHLLLHSPEEDAFWLFVSMMDAYLRPYFWSNPTQLEVDAALFSKALEGNDAQVFKKLMIDMSITPNKISHPWFSTLFVGALPPDYLNRVWDLFLSEGIPILIRTGMAIVYCCRRAILDSKSEEAACVMLRRPNPNWLPPSADAFIVLLNTVKLKDDDVRKQRVKMEQALTKRQAQQQAAVAPRSAASISLPRS